MMVYLETIEDEHGDVVEYKTYCDFHGSALDTYPVWPNAADCEECGVHLRDGGDDTECAHSDMTDGRPATRPIGTMCHFCEKVVRYVDLINLRRGRTAHRECFVNRFNQSYLESR